MSKRGRVTPHNRTGRRSAGNEDAMDAADGEGGSFEEESGRLGVPFRSPLLPCLCRRVLSLLLDESPLLSSLESSSSSPSSSFI